MKFRLKKKYLNFGLAVFAAASFSLVSPVAFAEGEQCLDKDSPATSPKYIPNPQHATDACNVWGEWAKDGNEAEFTLLKQNADRLGISMTGNAESASFSNCSTRFQYAKSQCGQVISKLCNQCKNGDKDCNTAKSKEAAMEGSGVQCASLAPGAKDTGTAANGGTTGSNTPTSTTPSGGGLGSALLPALLGAAAGFGAAKLMDKDKDKKDKDKDDANKSQDAVVCDANNNCAVDCTKDTAWEYSDCNEQEATACAGNLSDSTCQQFSGRYCSVDTAEGTTVDGYTKNKNGEGIGTAFCDKVAATNYCATSGRDQCPSCLQLNNSQLAACQANPSLCLAQNTAAQIEQARTTCPDDPIFANPEYTAGGSATVTDPNAPDPVVSDPNATAVAATDTTSNPASAPSSTSFVTASANSPAAAASSAMGQAPDVASGSGSTGFSSGGMGGGMGVASVGGRTASGGILPGRVASASASGGINRGPASDVSGQYSSSLFLESSQAIAKRCQQGRLLHCL